MTLKSRRLQTNNFRLAMLVAVCGSAIVLSFQNCSQPIEPTDSVQLASKEAIQADFAYDVSYDQMAYMSCSQLKNGEFDRSAYFTFRLGAYKYGGLKIRDSFLSAYEKKKPEFITDILENSEINKATIPQLALRRRLAYQTSLSSDGVMLEGSDYFNVFETLGTPDMIQVLMNLQPGESLRYLRNGTVYGARMEGSLYFADGMAKAASVRSFLKSDMVLASTFTHNAGTNNETIARSPAHLAHSIAEQGFDFDSSLDVDPNKSVYGLGYNVSFARPSLGGIFGQYPDVIMNEITEANLENISDRSSLHSWYCPSNMRFRIVRDADVQAGLVTCNKLPDPSSPSEDITLIRNILKSEDWWVDRENNCIIAKKSGPDCYGQVQKIIYDQTQECNTSATGACVDYASLCMRVEN